MPVAPHGQENPAHPGKPVTPSRLAGRHYLPLWLLLTLLVAVGVGCTVWYLQLRRQRSSEATHPETVADHWRQAQLALADHDPLSAREHLQVCLETWPAHAEAHFLMARACRQTGDMDGWQRYLQQATLLRWSPEQIHLERLMGLAQLGDLKKSEQELLARLREGTEEKALIVEALARGFLEVGQFPYLVTIADRWLQEHPDDWHMLLYRGRGQQLMGAREKAQDDFERVLALRPGQHDAQIWLGSVLMLDGHFEPARKYFAAACEQRPDDANARFGLAYCAFHLGDIEVALEHLNRLLRTDPNSARGLLLRGRIALADGNFADAIRWLAKAEAVAPGQTDITQAYADALRQAGRLQEAQRYHQKANEILALAGELERTEQRIWQKPDDVALRCQAADLNLKLHHDKEALRWLDSVLKTDPACTTAHALLAQYYERQGNHRQAVYHRQRAGKVPQVKPTAPPLTNPPPTGNSRLK